MSRYLMIVNRAIEEHHTISGNIKLVGESVNDLEALFSLREVYHDWTQSSTTALAEKLGKLQQTVSALEEGLSNHFDFEERALPPLLGEILTQALLLEHREIKKRISEAKSMMAGIELEGLKQEELLSRKSHLQQVMSGVCQIVERHANKEEIILKMMQRALEETPEEKGPDK